MPKKTGYIGWDFALEGPQVVAAYNSPGESAWVKRITGAATIAKTTGGIAVAMDATLEVQNAAFYHTDILNFDIDDLLGIRVRASASVAIGAASRWFIGMGSAYNAAPDSLAAMVGFIADASSAVKVESDDGTNDKDDIATGETLTTTVKEFYIDFCNGQGTHNPPSRGVGGKGNVLFSMSKGRDLALSPVARGTKFDMSNYSSGLQPYVQLLKASGTNVGTLLLRSFEVWYRDRP